MPFKLVDRARQSVSGTPGTGVVTLGAAVSGYQTFSEAGINNGDTFPYSIDDTGPTWEYGVATFSSTAGGQITRAVSKSNLGVGSPITLTSKAVISATVRAEDIVTATPARLDSLIDVNINEATMNDDDTLLWDVSTGKFGSGPGGGGGGGGSLATLSDVSLSTPTNNQVLSYQTSGTAKWKNFTIATVGITGAYSDLSGKPTIPSTVAALTGDVDISSPADDDVLTYVSGSSKWENKPASGGGGSGVTVEDAGSSLGTATTINFAGMASVTLSGSTATVTGNSGGGGGGSAPTVVQSAVFIQGDGPYVMGSTPTPGNLLVALISHWSSSVTVGAGWTMLLNVSGSNDCESIFIKVATSSDTTSLSPCTSGNDGCSTTIFELAGAAFATPVLLGQFHDVSSTSQLISTFAPSNSIVVGHFTTTGGDTLPTLSGVTAGPTDQAASGTGSGYARGIASFYDTVTSGATITATGTYGSSVDANGAIIVIQGTGTV